MKKLAALFILLSAFNAGAQTLALPEIPSSQKYEDISTRGVELCMNLNYVLALELQASMVEKHKKTPFIDPQELTLLTEFDPYRIHMIKSAMLGAFLTDAASDLIDGFIPDEDTLRLVQNYNLSATQEDLKKTVATCNKYVEIILPKVDPQKNVYLAIEGQKKLLSENLFEELKKLDTQK